MKKILVINGHPDKESLCQNLALAYKNAADKSKAECKLINLYELSFDPVLHYGYRQRTELEPVKSSDEKKRQRWLSVVEKLGMKGK